MTITPSNNFKHPTLEYTLPPIEERTPPSMKTPARIDLTSNVKTGTDIASKTIIPTSPVIKSSWKSVNPYIPLNFSFNAPPSFESTKITTQNIFQPSPIIQLKTIVKPKEQIEVKQGENTVGLPPSICDFPKRLRVKLNLTMEEQSIDKSGIFYKPILGLDKMYHFEDLTGMGGATREEIELNWQQFLKSLDKSLHKTGYEKGSSNEYNKNKIFDKLGNGSDQPCNKQKSIDEIQSGREEQLGREKQLGRVKQLSRVKQLGREEKLGGENQFGYTSTNTQGSNYLMSLSASDPKEMPVTNLNYEEKCKYIKYTKILFTAKKLFF